MSWRGVAMVMLTVVALVLTVPACDEGEPEERFNTDLATDADDRPLLPTAGVFHRAHDASLREGGGRATATLVQRDDVEAVAEAASQAVVRDAVRDAPVRDQVVTVGEPSTAGMGSALGNVGKAFLGNLLGASPPVQGTPTGGEGVPAADLAAVDAEAIRQVLDEYNRAYAAKDFPELVRFCVDRQRGVAEEFFDLKDELNASLEAVLEALEEVNPEAKAQAQSQLAAAFVLATLENLSAAGEDAAAGTSALAGGAQQVPVRFERESGQWLMVHPAVPSDADWPALKSTYEAVVDDLDELSTALAGGGEIDQDGLRQTLGIAVTLLLDRGGT